MTPTPRTRPTTVSTRTSAASAINGTGGVTAATRRTPGTIIKGLASLLALLVIVLGVPTLLIRLGAYPHSAPTGDGVLASLTQQDSGPLLQTVLTVGVWLAWAAFTLAVIREALAAVRSRGTDIARPLSGLGAVSVPAASLVHAVAALFVAAPVVLTAVTPATATAATTTSGTAGSVTAPSQARIDRTPASTPTQTTTSPITGTAGPATDATTTPDAQTEPESAQPAATHQGPSVTVARRDTLWKLAETHLGDPMRWSEIRDLNARQLAGSTTITPGMVLRLPADATTRATSSAAQSAAKTVTVHRGDTLSEIAVDHHRSPAAVAAANIGRPQPDGDTLTDPDHIEPGWTLALDTAAHHTPATTDVPATTHVPATQPTHEHQRPATKATPSTPPSTPPASAASPIQTPATAPATANAPAPAAPAPVKTKETPTKGPGSLTIPDSAHAVPAPQPTSAPTATAGSSVATQAPAPSPSTSVLPSASGAASSPAETAARATADSAAGVAVAQEGDRAPLVELVAGGSAAMLAGGVLTALLRSRRHQARHRRPGHTLISVPTELVPVERDLIVTGPSGIVDADYLDRALRALAGHVGKAPVSARPDVIAARMNRDGVTLRLVEPRHEPPHGWTVDESGLWWSLPADALLPAVDGSQLAPLPALVTVGGAGNSRWMLDLERAGTIRIHGGHDHRVMLARFMAAELAVNTWSDLVQVTCVGFGAELVDLAPDRVSHLAGTREDLQELRAQIEAVAEATFTDGDALTARVEHNGADSVMPHIILIGPDAVRPEDHDVLAQVLDALAASPTRTSLAVVLTDLPTSSTDAEGRAATVSASQALASGLDVVIDADGTLRIDELGMAVTAETLTEDEARGMAGLLAVSRQYESVPFPDMEGDKPWMSFATADGSLRRALTLPRDPAVLGRPATADDPTSILAHTDETYLMMGATTPEEIDVLSPLVPQEVCEDVEQADPTLDDEVAAWWADDCDRPKVRVLGPVEVTGVGTAPTNRLAHYTELVVYLATRPYGATADQVADAFDMTPARAATDVSTVRKWMGKTPDGTDYIPSARRSTAAATRGIGTYELRGALVDSDLFRRLRLRGLARGGDEGLRDLKAAMDLVTGRPFDHLAPGGYTWLLEGDRLDLHLTHAIVDTAHQMHLAAEPHGGTPEADEALRKAKAIAPHEDILQIDDAARIKNRGDHAAATRQLRTTVIDRSEDGGSRDDLPERTREILTSKGWMERAS